MTRTMMLIPMLAAVLACGALTEEDDAPIITIVTPVAPAEDTAERVEEPQSTPEEETVVLGVTGEPVLPLYAGDSTIEEKTIESPVVVKATMVTFSAETMVIPDAYSGRNDTYSPVLKFSLNVSEYLKGMGPSSIVAVWVDDRPYDTNEDAAEAKADILEERDDQWDDREAIIFLFDDAGGFGTQLDAQLQRADHFLVGVGDRFSPDDRYSLHSNSSRYWLPAASSAVSAGDGQEFLLEVPSSYGAAETITLGELKTRIADVTAEFGGGDGSAEYQACVLEKYRHLRNQSNFPEDRGSNFTVWNIDQSIASGQPTGTVIDVRRAYGTYPDTKITYRFEGRDGYLFDSSDGDSTDIDRDKDGQFETIEYDQMIRLARPLPAGEYRFDLKEVWPDYALCGFVISNTWTVRAVAPAGVLHEAFFDPVSDGASVAADDTKGVLKPRRFSDADGASAVLKRIGWEPGEGSGSGEVSLELDPPTGIGGHIVDFISLDGSVRLSLQVADAKVGAADDTLSWSVGIRPWSDGDRLMLRIREVPACSNGTVVPNPSDNSGLVRDCIVLLGLRDGLGGAGALNWSVERPITDWEGVRVQGSPSRVRRLELVEKSLTGTVPPTLGSLDALERLWLGYNDLSGEIPSSLGMLSRLKSLTLNHNELTGVIPSELGSLSRMEGMWLSANELSGEIPASLGNLSRLKQLTLADNRLSGNVPSVLGGLTSLEVLHLNYNDLTGEIPSSLESLSSLDNLLLGDNSFSGCIPAGLRDVDEHDLGRVGLPYCSAQ